MMRRKEILITLFAVVSCLLFFGIQGEALAVLDVEKDFKELCEEAYKNANGTRDIVAGVIKKVESENPDPSEEMKSETEDAKFWFKKADDLLNKVKAQMDAGNYTKELSEQLNQSWQWYIKAGTAIVRASQLLE
jgi:hypothetical protein